MELRHIRYFLAVAEQMNFTKAAEKLMIAQPPLSRQIQDLEAQLGAPLFIRNPHKLRLTQEGALFRQYAQQIIDLADKAVDEVGLIHSGLHGTLFLGTVEGSAPHLLSSWISSFHQINPHVQYDLWNGNSDDVTQRVIRGLCELAIIMAPYNAQELEALPVYEQPWIAILSCEHPLAMSGRDKITLQQLGQCDLLVPSRQSRQLEIGGWFNNIGMTPHIICRLANMINAIELAEKNVGVAIFPASQGKAARLTDSVCIREIDSEVIRARYVLIRAKNRSLSRVAGEFYHFLRDQALRPVES